MVRLSCLKPGCGHGEDDEPWKTEDVEAAVAVQLLQIHRQDAHNTVGQAGGVPAAATSRLAKLVKPTLPLKDGQIEEEGWEYFLHRYESYKQQAGPEQEGNAKQHLADCLGEEVARAVFSRLGQTRWEALTEAQLQAEAKLICVKARNRAVNRLKLSEMKQGPEQAFRMFLAQVEPVARTCRFTQKCPKAGCGTVMDFTEQMVLDTVVRGLHDQEVKKKVLAKPETECTLAEVEKFVSAEEVGAESMRRVEASSGDLMPLSTYRKQKAEQSTATRPEPAKKGGGCYRCGSEAHRWGDMSEEERKAKCEGYNATCQQCKKKGHMAPVCRQKASHNTMASERSSGEERAEEDTGLLAVNGRARGGRSRKSPPESKDHQAGRGRGRGRKADTAVLGHLRYDGGAGRYVPTAPGNTRRIKVEIAVDKEQYGKLGGRSPGEPLPRARTMKAEAVGDTGASICCVDPSLLRSLGVREEELLPTSVPLYAADKRRLRVRGCVPVTVRTRTVPSGTEVEVRDLLYVVDGIKAVYLSLAALKRLGAVPASFPEVPDLDGQHGLHAVEDLDGYEGPLAECGCPLRVETPEPPKLERPASEYTREELERNLIRHYRGSTFNTCPHQRLPYMKGSPPLEVTVDPTVRPYACHTPAAVPAHWKEQVKKDLDRDVVMGVIERVPENVDTTWCHRMVLTRKHSGGVRRNVDLQPLNKACQRQTHPCEPPLQQALTVPGGMLKTKTDAFQGFHSCKLRESDKDYFTFITPWGRYRYVACPMGWLASSDGYNDRYDRVIQDVERKRKVTDDLLLYDKDMQTAYERGGQMLTRLGRHGILQNADKFEFAKETLEWAGIKMTPHGAEPLPEHVEAISNYPVPVNVTDMRSFFALVEQVAPYHAVKPHMAPFRELLKKGQDWYWDDQLQRLFEEAKRVISKEVTEGITRFDPKRETALVSDYSRQGVGFLMLQKYCRCEDITPACCKDGWRVCLVGSRFCSQAEANYEVTAGELVAVVHALQKTKYYTLGSDRLTVCVDHKPLLGILNDTALEKIDNPRLRRLKEKTLCWRFRVRYLPGASPQLGGADALSRMRLAGITTEQEQVEGQAGDATRKDLRKGIYGALARVTDGSKSAPDAPMDGTDAVLGSMEVGVRAVTWGRVKEAVEKDPESQKLAGWIEAGCPGHLADLQDGMKPYWKVRTRLGMQDGVPMYGDRVIVPGKLRQEVLDTLHSAHQGVYGMMLRAAQAVYWPGFSREIENTRAKCGPCDRAAPSQSNLPPVESEDKIEYPFQHVVMDVATVNGKKYGVFCDRYTGWPGVYYGEAAQDADDCLRKLSEDYGCPETLTTDGGPCYISAKVQQTMKDYGIRHRLTSVANPHANARAEIAVKTIKRLLKENMTITGKLDTTKMSRALLQYRNTADRDTGLSPAQALFGRELRDFLPRGKETLMGDKWHKLAEQREKKLATREERDRTKWSEHVKKQKTLAPGDHVHVQNQRGNTPKRWDKHGVVVASKGHDQYDVRLDGSRRLTLRNRKFLRPFHPAAPHGQARELPAPGNEPARGQEPVKAPTPQPGPAHAQHEDEREQNGAHGTGQRQDEPDAPALQEYPEYATPPRSPERAQPEAEQEFATPPQSPERAQPEAERGAAEEPEARWPTRVRRPPAWQRSGDWDTSTHQEE
jgi:hypothetical protein